MKSEWQRPEGGGRFAVWLIRTIGLYGGRWMARLVLYPVTLYFYLRRGHERRCMRSYFARLQGRPGSAWQIMHLIHSFAATLLDRIFLLTGGADKFEVETEGLEELRSCLAEQRGLLLIGSHFGSFEVLRAISSNKDAPAFLRIVLDKQQTPALTSLLEELAPEISETVIDISRGGTGAVLAMAETVQKGGIVGLLADRARPNERCTRVPFLGEPAPFPVAPWQLASTLEVPIMLCFGVYLGGRRYRVVFEPFSDGVRYERRCRDEILRATISRYAARLEHYTRAYPYNWFNFHDFWQGSDAAEQRDASDDATVAQRSGEG